jgi:hypothetical protein
MKQNDRRWLLLQLVTASLVAVLPLLLARANPLRDLPSLAGGLDPLLQCGILQWVLRHAPLHESAWQAPFFHPAPFSLAYMDTLFGQSLLIRFLPGMKALPALAYNLCLVGTLFLAFLFTVRLGRELELGRAAALLSALVFTVGPQAAGHYHHLNQLPTPWLPAALWGMLRVSKGRWDGLLLFALAVGMQPFWGFYNLASLWMSVLLAVVFLLPTLRSKSALVLALLLAGGLLWARHSGVPYERAADAVAGFMRGPESVGPFAGRPFDFLHPPATHLLPWPTALENRPVLYAGLLWPLVALWGFFRVVRPSAGKLSVRAMWWAMATAGLCGLVLSFGRSMPLPGVGEVPLPLAWLQDRFWALQSLRAPTRLFLPGSLFLALAGSYAAMQWRRRSFSRAARSVLTGILFLALLDLLPGALQRVRAQPDAEERALLTALSDGTEQGAWIALPTPCSEEEETALDARCMLWSALSGRPVAGGSSGFVPMEVRRLRRACCRGMNEYCLADLKRDGVKEVVAARGMAESLQGWGTRLWRGEHYELWRLR